MEMPEVFTVLSIQTKPKLAVTMARNIAIYNSLLCCWFFFVRQRSSASQLNWALNYFSCICWKSHQKWVCFCCTLQISWLCLLCLDTQIGFNHLQLIVSLKRSNLHAVLGYLDFRLGLGFGLRFRRTRVDSDCNYELTWIQKDSGGLRLGHFGHRNVQTNSCHV